MAETPFPKWTIESLTRKYLQDSFDRAIYSPTPFGRLNALHEAWSKAVFGEQLAAQKSQREPTESEKAHIDELKRICRVT